MSLLGTMVVNFTANVAGLQSGVKNAKNSISSLNAPAMAVAGAIIGIGVAGALAAAKTVQMAGDFQSQMELISTGAGAAQGDIAGLSQSVLKMAVDTAEPTSQLTAGLFQIYSAGQKGSQALNTLQMAAEGAKVENASLGTVANAVTTAMTDYASTGLTAAQATNTLIAVVKNGKTNLQDLSGAMASILPIAATAHISLNDVAGAFATMTNEGVPAADAATYLRQTILALDNPTSKASGEMKLMGLSSASVAAEMQKSLPTALEMITDAAGKHFPVGSAKYVSAVATMIGGTKSLQGIFDLTGDHLDTFKTDVGLVSDAVKKGGNQIIGWSDVQSTFNFKMQQAQEVFETTAIKIGTGLLPVVSQLSNAFGFLVGVATNVFNFFNNNATALEVLKVVVIALAGAIGGLLVAALRIATINAWLFLQPFLINPVTLWIVGITALIALIAYGVILAVQHWGQIVAWLHSVWSSFLGWFNGILGDIKGKWGQLEGFFRGLWSNIVSGSKSAWDNVSGAARQGGANLVSWWNGLVTSFAKSPIGSSIIKTLQDQFGSIGQLLGQTGQSLKTQFGGALSGVQSALGNLGNSLQTVWQQQLVPLGQAIAGPITQGWKYFKDGLSAIGQIIASIPWHSLLDAIRQVGSIVGGLLTSAWQKVSPILAQVGQAFAWLGSLLGGSFLGILKTIGIAIGALVGGVILLAISVILGALVGLAKGLATLLAGVATVITGIIQIFSGFIQIITGIVAFIVDLFTGHFNKLGADLGVIWNGVKTLFTGVWNVIKGVFIATIGTIISVISGFVGTVIEFFASLASSMGVKVSGMVTNVINFFKDLPQNIMNFLNALPGMIVNLWNSIINDAKNAGTNIVKGIGDGIKNALHFVTDAIGGVTSWISSHLPHSPAKVGPLRDLALQGSMIPEQIAQGMIANRSKLDAALLKMTQPIANYPASVSNSSSAILAAVASGNNNSVNNQQQVIENHIYIDGKEVTAKLGPHIANAIRAKGVRSR